LHCKLAFYPHFCALCLLPIDNESVPKIIINNIINFFSWTAISILVISNYNNFWVLFDQIASVYFICKNIFIYLTLEMASQGNYANCIGALLFAIRQSRADTNLLVWPLYSWSSYQLNSIHVYTESQKWCQNSNLQK